MDGFLGVYEKSKENHANAPRNFEILTNASTTGFSLIRTVPAGMNLVDTT